MHCLVSVMDLDDDALGAIFYAQRIGEVVHKDLEVGTENTLCHSTAGLIPRFHSHAACGNRSIRSPDQLTLVETYTDSSAPGPLDTSRVERLTMMPFFLLVARSKIKSTNRFRAARELIDSLLQ